LLELGAQLSEEGANNQALDFFGVRWMHESKLRSFLAELEERGLTDPCAPDAEQLEKNNHVATCVFGRSPDGKLRRLCMAFDRTYVVPTTTLAKLACGRIRAGGAYRPPGFSEPNQAKIPIVFDEKGEAWMCLVFGLSCWSLDSLVICFY
jgi:hypothetical protein